MQRILQLSANGVQTDNPPNLINGYTEAGDISSGEIKKAVHQMKSGKSVHQMKSREAPGPVIFE